MPAKKQHNLSSGAEVWLTDPAVVDLHRLDGAPLVWALKKTLLLETNPQAGEPLLDSLIGYRKLVVGNRDWRIVWRVLNDERGAWTVEVVEVWAVGARSDNTAYAEMTERVGLPGRQPGASVLVGDPRRVGPARDGPAGDTGDGGAVPARALAGGAARAHRRPGPRPGAGDDQRAGRRRVD